MAYLLTGKRVCRRVLDVGRGGLHLVRAAVRRQSERVKTACLQQSLSEGSCGLFVLPVAVGTVGVEGGGSLRESDGDSPAMGETTVFFPLSIPIM